MDGYIVPEELTLTSSYGYTMVIFGALLLLSANFYYKIKKLHDRISVLELEDLLEDLQEKKE